MKRPFFVIGFTATVATLIAFYINFLVLISIISLAVLFIILNVLFKSKHKKTIFFVLSTIILFTSFAFFRISIVHNTMEKYCNRAIMVSGYATDMKAGNNGLNEYSFRANSINGTNIDFDFKIFTTEEITFFDECFLQVQTFKKEEDFSSLASVYISGYVNDNDYPVVYSGVKKDKIGRALHDIREKSKTILLSSGDRVTSSFILGCVTGDKTVMSNDTLKALQKSGLSHILAISGMNLSLILNLFIILFKKTGINRWIKFIILAIINFAIMAFVGFSPSITRAGIMMMIFVFAKALRKTNDSLNALGISALLMVILSPFNAANIGFLLSVAATFGIIVLHPIIALRINRKLKFKNKILIAFAGYFSLSLSAAVFTTPILAFFIGELSIIAPIANTAVSVLIPPLVIGGIILLIFGFIQMPSIVFTTLALPVNGIAFLMLKTTKFFSLFPFAVIPTKQVYLKILLCLFVIFICFYIFIKDKNVSLKRIKIYSLSFICIILASTIIFEACTYNQMNFKNYNSEKYENNYIIALHNHKTFVAVNMLDKATTYKIIHELDENNIKSIDYLVVISASDANHTMLMTLNSSKEVNTLIAPQFFDNSIKNCKYYPLDDYGFNFGSYRTKINNFNGQTSIIISAKDNSFAWITESYDIKKLIMQENTHLHRCKKIP